jgi:uncharacterized protein (TIGR03435 family)
VPEKPCRNTGVFRGGVLVLDLPATTLDDLVAFQLGNLDRPAVNKTGIFGRFDVHLEFTPDEVTARLLREPGAVPGIGAADPSGPSVFTALQDQLGLKLEPSKGPGEFLVIDHVERPSAN